MRVSGIISLLVVMTIWISPIIVSAQIIQQDDLIFGLSQSPDDGQSVQQLRGPAEEFGGEGGLQDGFWSQPFIQAVEFDNLNGISHNPQGNLLGLNFGRSADGGAIYNFSTTADNDGSQLIGDAQGLGGDITLTRMGGLSVSPDNNKIAITGYDTGQVIVFDYTAGDTIGGGASLANGRESSAGPLSSFDTQGTTWLNGNEVMSFATDGQLFSVDATSMEKTILAGVETGGGEQANRSEYTDIEYNPAVSPYVYASYGSFDRDFNEELNLLFVVDPRDSFSLVKTVDLSESTGSFREIAMDSQGNLFLSQFGGTIDVLQNVAEPASLEDHSSLDWYFAPEGPSFSGLDVATAVDVPGPGDVVGDFNKNGILDAPDINMLTSEVNLGENNLDFDLNADNLVNNDDRAVWVEDLKNTYFGDANFDLLFDSGDLVTVFSAGEYEDEIVGNSVWETGDWNGDTEFGTGDLVSAFQAGGYDAGPRAAVAAIPEPSSWVMLVLAGLLMAARRR